AGNVDYIDGQILHLNRIPEGDRVLIGYVIGGINSSAPNIFWINDGTQSRADQTVYAVYLKKGESRDIEVSYIEPPSEIKLAVNPNPVEDVLYAEIQLPEGEGFYVRIVNMKGETVYFKQIPMVIGVFRMAMDVRELSQGAYILEVGSKNAGRKTVVFVKV
ncbi:MAG: T9SS type A sorting domain-containing protein, partial [Chlorobi bacterium]|nr:T9SS type A sorting domain-containing protein [Chlorobiota bacterium]